MDTNITKLIKKVELWAGHPATIPDTSAVIPTGGVFSRDDLESFMDDARVDAVRYALDYTLASNLAGASVVWTALEWWADDAQLQNYNWSLVTADVPRPDIGRWDFSLPHIYPLYLTGRTYDLHRVTADVLEAWASRVKLEHDLAIGNLNLKRHQKAAKLMELAAGHRRKQRFGSVRIHDDSVLSTPGRGKAWKLATSPPPM